MGRVGRSPQTTSSHWAGPIHTGVGGGAYPYIAVHRSNPYGQAYHTEVRGGAEKKGLLGQQTLQIEWEGKIANNVFNAKKWTPHSKHTLTHKLLGIRHAHKNRLCLSKGSSSLASGASSPSRGLERSLGQRTFGRSSGFSCK